MGVLDGAWCLQGHRKGAEVDVWVGVCGIAGVLGEAHRERSYGLVRRGAIEGARYRLVRRAMGRGEQGHRRKLVKIDMQAQGVWH
jgi:hypothetical protein